MVALLRALGPDEERSTGRVLEHLTYALTRPCRALEIVTGTNLLCYRHALFTSRSQHDAKRVGSAETHAKGMAQVHKTTTHLLGSDRPLVGLPQLLNDPGVPPKILLATDQDDRKPGAKVHHFGNPLLVRGAVRIARVCYQGARRTFSCTLSSESGESTAKQMRMTWESG